jgi:hypothetical protein
MGPVGLPPGSGLGAFSVMLKHDAAAVVITSADVNQMLAANPGSDVLDVVDPVPGTTGSFGVDALDIGTAAPETGDGVLARLTVEAVNSFPAYSLLRLSDPSVLDMPVGGYPEIAAAGSSVLALGLGCAAPDSDGDGVIDPADNCPDWPNPDQRDNELDGVGDGCDTDDDNAGVSDTDEIGCGGNPAVAALRPERTDGIFAGLDDNGNGLKDEALGPTSGSYDCDGDGYSGVVEDHVFGAAARANQDPCGTDAWPADFVSGGIPDSTNKVTVTDVTSFLAPERRFNTSPGDPAYNVRWDLVPGAGLFSKVINVADLTSVITVSPPMTYGARAFSGPACPWPP